MHACALRCSLVSSAASLALLAALAAPAAAQFNLFNWALQDPSGDGVNTLAPDKMTVIANFPTLGGGVIAGYTAVAPVDARVTVDMWYMPFDGTCGKSVPVFVLNGTPTILASCYDVETLLFSVPAGASFGFGLQTFDGTWPGWVQFSNFHFDPVPPFNPWTDLGGGLAGSGGVPLLDGISLLYPHGPLTLVLTGAAPNAPVSLVAGFSALNVPFKGGVLVPSPDVVVPGLVTDVHGALSLATQWLGAPSGFVFYVQAWIADAAGPHGFAASNALHAQTP